MLPGTLPVARGGGNRVIFPESRAGLWARAIVAAGFYLASIVWILLSIAFIVDDEPTSDPNDVAGFKVFLVFAVLCLAVTAFVSRRWKVAWVCCLLLFTLIVVVWTQVPSWIAPYGNFQEPPRRF